MSKHADEKLKQLQKMAQKQDILQAQNQALSNEILCKLLSAAEIYHNRTFDIKEKEIFGYYNTLNSGHTKSMLNLKKQLLNQYELFKNSYEGYTLDYEYYDFPDNLKEDSIIEIVRKWEKDFKKCNDKNIKNDAKYYRGIIHLIEGNLEDSFRKDLKELNKVKNKEGTIAKNLMESIGSVQEVVSQIEIKVKNSILKNGYYIQEVQLDKSYTDDINMMKAQKMIEKNKELLKNIGDFKEENHEKCNCGEKHKHHDKNDNVNNDEKQNNENENDDQFKVYVESVNKENIDEDKKEKEEKEELNKKEKNEKEELNKKKKKKKKRKRRKRKIK